MKKAINKAILRMAGWKLGLMDGMGLPRCIVCVTSHTNNWDFIVGKLFCTSIGRNTGFLIKGEWFLFPFNLLSNWLGGVPVDRGKRTSATDQMVKRFETGEWFQLAVMPEGTRKRVKRWKKGFYFIALKANVSIVMTYFDYGEKEAGMKGVFHPTDDIDKDIHTTHKMRRGVTARHPENSVRV